MRLRFSHGEYQQIKATALFRTRDSDLQLLVNGHTPRCASANNPFFLSVLVDERQANSKAALTFGGMGLLPRSSSSFMLFDAMVAFRTGCFSTNVHPVHWQRIRSSTSPPQTFAWVPSASLLRLVFLFHQESVRYVLPSPFAAPSSTLTTQYRCTSLYAR